MYLYGSLLRVSVKAATAECEGWLFLLNQSSSLGTWSVTIS